MVSAGADLSLFAVTRVCVGALALAGMGSAGADLSLMAENKVLRGRVRLSLFKGAVALAGGLWLLSVVARGCCC
jgi:hypothetical protein